MKTKTPRKSKATTPTAAEMAQANARRTAQAVYENVREIIFSLTPSASSVLKRSHVSVGRDESSFSDGTEAPREDDSLGFAFTITYRTRVTAATAVEIDLSKVSDSLRRTEIEIYSDGEWRSASTAEKEEALASVDIAQIFEEVSRDQYGSCEQYDLPSHFQDEVYNILDAHKEQSIEAYTSHDGRVDLPEYPSVHIKWKLHPAKPHFGPVLTQQSKMRIDVTASWNVLPHRWAYGTWAYSRMGSDRWNFV